MALSNAERQRAFRQRRTAHQPKLRYRKPIDRRSAPQKWTEAIEDLVSILNSYQEWRDGMPPGVADSSTAQKLDAVLELRGIVEELATAELPRGFGRD